jgi:hypothetical protein
VLPLIIGPLLAVSFELWAIYVEERWVYGERMPLIPVIGVGVFPLVQMIVIPTACIAGSHLLLHLQRRGRATHPGQGANHGH